MIKIEKKNGVLQDYDEQKIIDAVNKSASRVLFNFTEEDYGIICNSVLEEIDAEDLKDEETGDTIIPVNMMHSIVERVLLDKYPAVGTTYQQYRNYKLDFCKMLDNVYQKAQTIAYIGDVSNANTDSTMISTQRSLIYGQLNKELYQKFFLTNEENQACEDGYIYIHDMKDRRDGINCCLFDVNNVLSGGFEMGNIWYNEPNSLDVAFDVIGDIVLSAASQQYGGFTVPRIDTILIPYAEKTYKKYYDEYIDVVDSYDVEKYANVIAERADIYATDKVRREFEQGFQGWEYKFNTVGSSRGDYPFISISFGIETNKWGAMASEVALEVRKKGQGKKGFKRPVLFPKLTFLYDENLHGDGSDKYELGWLFEKAIDCSCYCMYPDYLSLTGKGYIPSMYKKYGKVVSLMG